MDITGRFERILAIYFQLQAKPIVKAQYLAEKFEVSLRTIYRDIRALEHAGIPIYGEAGIGYSLMNNYKIPPTLFTAEEALSFGVAEKLMQYYLDEDMSRHFGDALVKMKAVLRTADKENVAQVENQVLINKRQYFFNKNVPSALAILFESIAKKKQIHLHYKGVEYQEMNQRDVEPIGVFQEGEFWYFMAYCHLRKDVRQFRLDRIHRIELLDHIFTTQHAPLSTYLEKRQVDVEWLTIRIWVCKDMARYMVWEREYYGFVEEKEVEDGYEMHFKVRNSEHQFARWFLMFADSAIILEPASLKEYVRNLLQVGLRKIDAY